MIVPQTGFLNAALLSSVLIARQAAFLQLASEFHTFFRKSFSAITCAGSRTPQSDGMRTAQLRRPNGGNRKSYTARDWNASFAPQISLLFSPKSWFLVTGVCRNKHNLPQLDRSSETLEVTAGKHLSTLAMAQTCE